MATTQERSENGTYVGAPLRRVNDRRLMTGYGRFVDDIQLPETLHVVFVRSPHAHADLRDIDASAALAAPGVAAVLTGADLEGWLNPVTSHDALLPGRHLARLPL